MNIPLGIDLSMFGVTAALITIVGFYLNFAKYKRDIKKETELKESEHQKLHDEHNKVAKDNQTRLASLEEYRTADKVSNGKRKTEIAEIRKQMNDEFTDIKVGMGIIQTNQDNQNKLLEKIDSKLNVN